MKILELKYFAHIILLGSLTALALAYIGQYAFGLEPCVLCLYQRLPYYALIILALCYYKIQHQIVIFLAFLAFISGASLAVFHVGVEEGVFTMDSGCIDTLNPSTLEELRSQILGKSHRSCSEPDFFFLSLSMAGWNAIYSIFGAIYCLIVFLKLRRHNREQ